MDGMIEMTTRERWLNGWHRQDRIVLLGTSVHCAGCGQFQGITNVVFSDDWTEPESDPDWPFEVGNCPVHNDYRYDLEPHAWPRGKPRPLP